MNNYFFILDPEKYEGSIMASFNIVTKVSPYTGKTIDEYLKENPNCIVVESDKYYEQWYKPFMESKASKVTELKDKEEYFELIEQLPPVKWEKGCYWCSEALSGSYHTIWVSYKGRYFETMGCLFDSPDVILEKVNNFINQ